MKNSSLFIILQRMRLPFLVLLCTYTIAIIGLISIDGVDSQGQVYKVSIFDAFYFVSYMATTIGFGETPFEFTYAQRLWVNVSIYLTVIGWFYAIGTLISLLQDSLFIDEVNKNRFIRKVEKLKEKFILVLGYNEVTSEIIKKALENGLRAVVLEKDKEKINELVLENFTPSVYVCYTKNFSADALKLAGIEKSNCKALVSLFEDDDLNLKVSLTSKLLNKYVKVIAKATSQNHLQNLIDIDVEIIANPFSIISSEISMALSSPNLFKLERWLYKLDILTSSLSSFPKGKYIICGYGRLGKKIYEKLALNNIECHLIEIDKTKKDSYTEDEISHLSFGNADDKEMLLSVGIKDAVSLLAVTNSDITNLSIVTTAKKLNPNITTIVRENEMSDFLLFDNVNVNHTFIPSKILINKTINALINPLADKFMRESFTKDEKWATSLVRRLIEEIDEDPLIEELEINEKYTPEIYKYLEQGNSLNLDILRVSLYNYRQRNNIVPLLLQRKDEIILLPSFKYELKIADKILLACDKHAKDDIQYICQNIYEFHYALSGEEKRTIFYKGKK
ncbi:MAG: NAD-binding protein [Arcobacter sp.]|nr:NAD-binding protein [Arcobacter sp.]